MYGETLEKIIYETVTGIRISEDYLEISTKEGGTFYFTVHGDCCSTSYFSEVIGANKLINQGRVLDVVEDTSPFRGGPEKYDECQTLYGWKIVSDHPMFGEVTTFIGFRNESNGYYGGWCESCDRIPDDEPMINIVDNWMVD